MPATATARRACTAGTPAVLADSAHRASAADDDGDVVGELAAVVVAHRQLDPPGDAVRGASRAVGGELEEALDAEEPAVGIARLQHAVGVEHERVAGIEAERDRRE